VALLPSVSVIQSTPERAVHSSIAMSAAGRFPATIDHFFGTIALALKVYALVLIFSLHVTGSIRVGESVTRLDRLV
jgi:hypothetical protein